MPKLKIIPKVIAVLPFLKLKLFKLTFFSINTLIISILLLWTAIDVLNIGYMLKRFLKNWYFNHTIV